MSHTVLRLYGVDREKVTPYLTLGSWDRRDEVRNKWRFSNSLRYENKRLNFASYSALIRNRISGFITDGLIDLGVIKTYIKMDGINVA
jgi:hypothetical protein